MGISGASAGDEMKKYHIRVGGIHVAECLPVNWRMGKRLRKGMGNNYGI